MRFHRNAGARGAAEWVCTTPKQDRIFAYARVVLVKDVTFENNTADGWALGTAKWVSEPMSASKNRPVAPEIAVIVRPDALRRMPVHGWLPLRYVTGQGFLCCGRKMTGARWMLLGPGLAVVRRPRFA